MVEQNQKVKGIVDIVFLIDATGSMHPCITALKNNIQTFVTGLTTKTANNSSPVKDWRAKVVGYRDYEFDKEPLIDNPFISNVEELRMQLSRLEATGGEDEPESLLEAVFHLATMPQTAKGETQKPDHWRHRSAATRVIVVFTDASFKEPLAKPKGATLQDVFAQLITNRVILSIFAPQMPCYERLSEVDRSEWNVIEGGKTPQESMELYTSDQKNFTDVLLQLARTITKSADVSIIE
jgi:hypothetical protein